MSIKLLPASLNPVDPSPDFPTSLVPQGERAVTARALQISLVPSADVFAWSSSTRRSGPNRISATVVEDSPNDDKGQSAWEYVSGWAWNRIVEGTAVAHYLAYAASPANWNGRLIDLYA